MTVIKGPLQGRKPPKPEFGGARRRLQMLSQALFALANGVEASSETEDTTSLIDELCLANDVLKQCGDELAGIILSLEQLCPKK